MKQVINDLRDTFSKHQNLEIDSYLKSLPYFLLTGRKGFYFFRNETTSLSVARHPHKENTLLVFPELDGNGDLTIEVLEQLSKKNFAVQLARYTETDHKKFLKALERKKEKIISSISIKEEDILDWKYPARILDTETVLELKEKRFSNIRNKFNKVANSSEFTVVPLSNPDSNKLIRSTIYHWLAGVIYAGNETGYDLTEFYDMLLKQIAEFPSFFDGFILKNNKEALGFTIWDVTGDTANALAGLTQRSVSGMSEFQTITACKILNGQGIKKYNLGGSETKSLDNYKLKFHPVESIRMFSCDVNFAKKTSSPFEAVEIFQIDNLKLD